MDLRLDRHRYHFEEQRREVELAFESHPSYKRIKKNSEDILSKLVKEARGFGLNEKNCLFAVDGSFAFSFGRANSDLDGVLYLRDASLNKKEMEEKMSQKLDELHLTSNLRIFSKDEYPPSDDERAVALSMLVSGRYIIGDFDEKRVSLLAEIMGAEDILGDALDARFFLFWDETIEKYRQRLKLEGMSSAPETKD